MCGGFVSVLLLLDMKKEGRIQDRIWNNFSYSSERAMCLIGISLSNLIKSQNFSPALSGRGMCLTYVVKVTAAAFAVPLSALFSIL